MEPSTTEAQIRELESVRKQINLWRGGTVAVIVGTMVVCLGMLYSDAKALATPGPTQTVFVDALKSGLDENIVPRLKETASRTMTEMQPVIQKEFMDLNKRVPELTQKSLDEVNKLQTTLPETASKALTETFNKALAGKEDEIKKMYPDATEDQVKALFTNLTKVTGDRSTDMAKALLEPHVAQINDIHNNLQTIMSTEPKTGTNTDDWQLGLAVFDVVRDDLKDITLPNKQAKAAIVSAAGKIAEAAGNVKDAANHVANEANKGGK